MTGRTYRDGLTSTDVIGRLYQLGIATNRDRVAEISNALFHPYEVRSSTPCGHGHRRYTEVQSRAVVNAFVARHRLDLSLAQLHALLAEPSAVGLLRERHHLEEADLIALHRTVSEVCA